MTKEEPSIILIETSTALCSAAISKGGDIISYRESSEDKAHASKLAVFISEMLREQGMSASDCDAVAVSEGPGSYTGLRVGVSTAKGICFGAGIPLISVGTLDILAIQAIEEGLLPQGCTAVVPMIDARRMEVYCAEFSAAGERTGKVRPEILESGSFSETAGCGTVLFIGDGAEKFSRISSLDNAAFVRCWPKASAMLRPALDKYMTARFEDTAYFEPFYLKEFVATESRRKLI